jgi:hypothetical protein
MLVLLLFMCCAGKLSCDGYNDGQCAATCCPAQPLQLMRALHAAGSKDFRSYLYRGWLPGRDNMDLIDGQWRKLRWCCCIHCALDTVTTAQIL